MIDEETHDRRSDVTEGQSYPPLPNEDYYRQSSRTWQTSNTARLGMVLLIVGLIWLAVELLGYGPFLGDSQGVTLIKAPLPSNRIELDLGAGDVDIQVGTDQDIRVETNQRGAWRGNPVEISRFADHVQVRNTAESWLFGFCLGRCDLHYHVLVPHGVAISARTSSGDISVTGLDGAVSLTTSSGDVQATDIVNGIIVGSSSGDVRLSGVAGKLDVQTSSGDVNLEHGRVADANVQTSSGDIELQGVANALTLKSNSGDITVRDAHDGQLNVQTNSGGVDFSGDLAGTGDNNISTTSGDVTLRLATDAGFVLNASTTSGDLESNFDLHGGQRSSRAITGAANTGGPTLKIATISGDINVERR